MMKVISKDNAQHYTWGEVCDGWHLLKKDHLSVIQERVPPGAAEQRHYHQHSYQFFFVLSGQATLEVDKQTLILGPQQGLSVAPQQVHRLSNDSDQDLIFIVVSAPKSHGDRVLVDTQ